MSSSASLHVVRRPPPLPLWDTMTSESAADKGLCDKSITLRKHRKNVFNKTGESLPFVRFCLFCIFLRFVFSRFSLRLLARVVLDLGVVCHVHLTMCLGPKTRPACDVISLCKKTCCHFTYLLCAVPNRVLHISIQKPYVTFHTVSYDKCQTDIIWSW